MPQSISDHVQIVAGDISQNLTEPMEFSVGRITSSTIPQTREILLHIPLTRKFQYHIAATFCPTAFLLIIACLTLFINPVHFEATVGLALTTMLVMQTLQSNISSELPKTPYLKIIDIWLTFGMAVPFAVFLVLVLVEALSSQRKVVGKSLTKETKKTRLGKQRWITKERVHGFFKVLIPVCTAVFVGAFWIYAITIIQKIV